MVNAMLLLEILNSLFLWYEFWCTSIQCPSSYLWHLILNWSKWISVIDILNPILLTLLTFIILHILWKVTIGCGWFLFGVCYHVNGSIYTLKSDQWISFWWAKFELECLLIIFICRGQSAPQRLSTGKFLPTNREKGGKEKRKKNGKCWGK